MRKKINVSVLLIVILFIVHISDSIAGVQEAITSTLSTDNLIGSYKIRKDKKGHSENFVIKDDIAYIACKDRGLLILDISDKANPKCLNSYQFGKNSWTIDVFVEDGIAYVANSQGLKILDVSNPKKPTLLGSYKKEPALYVYVANGRAYVIGGTLDIVDVSDPSSPTLLVGNMEVGLAARGMYVSGNYLYVAGGGGSDAGAKGLQIYDISNPLEPVFLGEASDTNCTQIMYANGYLYGRASTPEKIDISDPASPYVVSYLSAEEVQAFDITDNKLYCYTGNDEIPFTGFLGFDLTSDEVVEKYSYHSKYSYIDSFLSDMKVADEVIYLGVAYAFEMYDLEGPAVISSLSNKKSVAGGAITITGEKFGTTQGKVIAKQGDKTYNCGIVSWSDTEINITLPNKIKIGAATIRVTKSTDLKSKNTKPITIIKKN